MQLKRGDVVVSVVSDDYAKARPAVVVQTDFFNPTHASVTVCPLTSHFVDAPLFRIPIEPGSGTGIKLLSQVMVDKIMSVPRERIGKRIGRLPNSVVQQIDEALRLWLDLRVR